MTIKRLASGKRIVSPNEDPGTLSVTMKLNAAVNRLSGAKNNVQNGISFVEVQDGVIETVGRIVGRMAELKGMATQDPMKSSQDVQSYNNEFVDLQKQLRDVSAQTFNGVSLFADFATGSDGTVSGHSSSRERSADNTIEIFTSSEGSSGTKISLQVRGAFGPDCRCERPDQGQHFRSGKTAMSSDYSQAIPEQLSRSRVRSDGVFEQALSNVAYLRAQTGGMSRLTFAADSISSMETNLRSAIGRIEDVDIAAESANLAKYSILTQASAAMVAQANSTSDIALMLLR